MKWQNKGHEFDSVYENIKRIQKYYLFGAGEYGAHVYELLKSEVSILGFIDNSTVKQQTEFCGKTVYSLQDIRNLMDRTTGIILTISPYARKPVEEQMKEQGFVKEKEYFTMEVFMSVYAAYEKSKLFIPSISFLPTTRCNLRCEACLNFTPYMEQFDERPWEQIQSDLDTFFPCIDYIMLFHISGGEPLLYPQLGRLIQYIKGYYGDKIHILRTVTNGTILPKPEILELMAEYQVELTVDDYRDSVPESSETFSRLIKRLEAFRVKYQINKVEEWIDLAPATTCHDDWSESRLQKQFNACHVPWQELRGGKLYSCNYASYAMVAGLMDVGAGDCFDLCSYTPDKLKELMEFRLGYNERGYVEFCKRCSGYVDINPNKVIPAKQLEK